MKTNKILIALVIILVAVNIFTISFLWLKDSPQEERAKVDGPPRVERFLKKKLKLSKEQQQLFKEARLTHFAKSRTLLKEMQTYRKQLLAASANDSQEITDSLFAELSRVQSNFERLNYAHMQTLRSYCDENQQITFDSVMFLMFEHLSSPEKRRLRKRRGRQK